MFTAMANGEGETTQCCAFNFPGVLQTVTKDKLALLKTLKTYVFFNILLHRWSQLEEAYFSLTRDVQWKVRRSLAHSLHEVARILGTELTETKLLPTFDLFLKVHFWHRHYEPVVIVACEGPGRSTDGSPQELC